MAISINWATKVITVPKSFMTYQNPTLYSLDVNTLRIALKDLEDNSDGMSYVDTHRHNSPVTLAGVTYARTLEIINGYTVTFEDGQYAVTCFGANHNLADVKNLNQVSLIIGNAAGLIVNTVNTGGGVGTVTEVADAVWNAVSSAYVTVGSTGAKLAAAGNSGDPWATDLSGYTVGTAGYDLKHLPTTVSTAVRAELAPELTHLMQVPITGTGLTVTQATMLLEMYELLGLDATKPLIVTDSTRSAGSISQAIATSPTETVVQRV